MYFDIPEPELDEILDRTPGVWERLRGARLFLTGGTGFFGRWLLASLLRANARLGTEIRAVVMSRNPDGFIERFPEAADARLGFHAGDLRYTAFPVGGFSHVLHVATDSKFAAEAEHLQIMDGIVTGTRRVLDFAVHRAGARGFLYVSSGAVYGPLAAGRAGYSEDDPAAPPPEHHRSLIGNAKRMAEQMCTLYHRRHGLETRVARCFSFVGPHLPMDSYFAAGNFIRDACRADAIHVAGDGSPVRSYLYAADLTAWLWRILVDGKPNRPYNVGSDRPVSMKELAHAVRTRVAPEKPVIVRSDAFRRPDLPVYVPDIERARQDLGLEVWTPLGEAIDRTARWYRTHGEAVVGASATARPRTFIVDIDGVIAGLTPDNEYRLATPLTDNIERINRRYDAGDRIVLFTARGSTTGRDWRAVTEAQLRAWGLRYHELLFGKPAGDFYVDDRMLPLELMEQVT
jgi:nucleoside-diphosphate-sugar epimerase